MSSLSWFRRSSLALISFSLFTLLNAGHAAQVSLGLQASATSGSLFGLGAHVMVSTPLNAARDLQLRGNLEGNLESGGVPDLLLDVTLIKRNAAFYYGVGVGSGVAFDFVDHGSSFPGIILSPIFLVNVHGVLGTTLSGGIAVEGLLRVGAAPRLEARVSFPLR